MNPDHPIRWGIVGLGRIAHAFARDLAIVEGGELVAVGSRSEENARAFASEHGAAHAFGSYESVFRHPDVDVVYVATPHHQHAELSIAALTCGKHVLCEKPVAINAAQTNQMIAAARTHKRFFMEGLWSRFIPAISEVVSQVKQGELGPIRYVQADFSFPVGQDAGSRIRDPEQGGGSMLDMGIYPVFLAYVLLGMPRSVSAHMVTSDSGVDEQMAVIMEYGNALATAYSGFASQSNMQATISGETGRIVLHPVWHETDAYSILGDLADEGTRIQKERWGHGLTHEIDACHTCIRTGQLEHPDWTHADSLNLMTLLDRIRESANLTYPLERPQSS